MGDFFIKIQIPSTYYKILSWLFQKRYANVFFGLKPDVEELLYKLIIITFDYGL